MIPISTILKHYKREDIRNELVYNGESREVAIRFGEGFGKRPDILENPNDIIELAKKGVTSFHVSEEIWKRPMSLRPELSKKDLDDIRTGWDLVIDVDCPVWEYSKVITYFVIQALKENGVTEISCKFSGNKGFHIGVPYEAFPEKVNDEETRLRFPDGVKIIAQYLIKEIDKDDRFTDFVLRKGLGDLLEKTQKTREEVVKPYCERCEIFLKEKKTHCPRCQGDKITEKLDVEDLIDVDTLLISSRHLYRMAYSLHEKSGLASLPIDPDTVLNFQKAMADPSSVQVLHRFLPRENVKPNDAALLFDRAFHWYIEHEKKKLPEEQAKPQQIQFSDDINEPLPTDVFPPCVNKLLEGIADGRKRAIFILINFFRSVGYPYQEIEEKIKEWNKKNSEQLREVYLKGQLHHQKTKPVILPPNCANEMYMKALGVCQPDDFCPRIKNPAQYAKKKYQALERAKKKKIRKKKEEPAQKPTPEGETSENQAQNPKNSAPIQKPTNS